MNFITELKWRGMIHDIMPGTEERLHQAMATGYVGYDPTAPSLHIGSLAPIMMQVHFQLAGHKPIVLIGGATGMVGDPSGRSEERPLLPIEEIRHNQRLIRAQLEKFLDFDRGKNSAEVVNNYDWFKGIEFLPFLRDVGKHLTINYMLAKESVRQRLEKGISFTEFSYQLLQAYDFYWLYEHKNCILQMGGSDQWGNITAGTELIRRKASGEAYALTCPLITRSDGSKFGKSEGENIWLSADMTSPYKFYQYWLNCPDEDAVDYMKLFTLFSQEEIAELDRQHSRAPHQRILQKALARDLTARVHSSREVDIAEAAAEILFGNGTTEALDRLSEMDFLSVFEGVPLETVTRQAIKKGINIVDLLAIETRVFPSKSEVRRMIRSGGVSINKKRVQDDKLTVGPEALLNGNYILIQKGKKNYFLLKIE
jgi:tyrosyl-tRNA synthetase